MVKLFGLEFAPILFVPMNRRLQTLAILFYCSEFLFAGLISIFSLLILLFTPLFMVPLAYIGWMIVDRNTPHNGSVSRTSKYARSFKFWNYVRDYFPIKLVKDNECNLDANENYIFMNHPHGIVCFGAFINFATDANKFSKLFPNITPTIITLEEQFKFPVHREYLLLMGARGASKESIGALLTKEGKGNAVVIILGGAREALDAVPHRMDLTLKNRKGIIKLAMKHG